MSYRSRFGTINQIVFENEHQYYEALGYLSKSDGSSEIVWEHNEDQGAWGSEGRIHFYVNADRLSAYFKHTAGRGRVVSRVNCNEFMMHIVENHEFTYGDTQDIERIRQTIPDPYLQDFDRGLNL